LSIGSHVCSTLPSDPTSRRRRGASLSLHLHQVVKRTFTSKLSNMLGTPGWRTVKLCVSVYRRATLCGLISHSTRVDIDFAEFHSAPPKVITDTCRCALQATAGRLDRSDPSSPQQAERGAPCPRRLVRTPVAVHLLPLGEGKHSFYPPGPLAVPPTLPRFVYRRKGGGG